MDLKDMSIEYRMPYICKFISTSVFVAEILSERIKNVNGTKGFQYKNSDKEMKHVQHVDDMTLSLKKSHAVNTINIFC